MCINRILTLPLLAIGAGLLTMAASGRSVASPDPTAAAATCSPNGESCIPLMQKAPPPRPLFTAMHWATCR